MFLRCADVSLSPIRLSSLRIIPRLRPVAFSPRNPLSSNKQRVFKSLESICVAEETAVRFKNQQDLARVEIRRFVV